MRRFFLRRTKDSVTGDDPPSGSGAGGGPRRSPKTFPSGIKLLHSPETSVVDIVFIHGLTGDRERTWRAKGAELPWPQSLLPFKVLNARILTFGYDSYVSSWEGVVSQSRIANHSWNLLTALSAYRGEDGTHERPIIFVCHSLGGLVCEDALVTSKQRDEPHLQNIFRLTRGIIFLGTPHRGSSLAPSAEMLAKKIGLIKKTNTKIVKTLKRDSETLARIQDSFHTMILARRDGLQPIQITCFYEMLPLPYIGFVVPQDSAILAGYIPIGIRRNHQEMTKFDNIEDPDFLAICGELCRWIRELQPASTTEIMPVSMKIERNSTGSLLVIPFGRNADFTGRDSILKQVLERIHPSADKDNCQRTIIEGLGGIGKTQIALEAAYRVWNANADCSVFWVPAMSITTFENAYREIGQVLGIKDIDKPETDVKKLVNEALNHSLTNWLLIVDNIDDMELFSGTTSFSKQFPFCRNGSILFTTRNHDIAIRLDIPERNIITITKMDQCDAVRLLQRTLKPEQVRDDQSELLEELAFLPLAIKQASAFMGKTGISTTEYLNHCRSSDKSLIRLLSKDFEDQGRYETIENPIATTWLISFSQITRANPLATEYLKYISFMSEKDIQRFLLPAADPMDTDEAIGILKAYAFITERGGQNSYLDKDRLLRHTTLLVLLIHPKKANADLQVRSDVHRLVRIATQNWIETQGDHKKEVTYALAIFRTVFPTPLLAQKDEWLRCLPHALNVLGFRDNVDDDDAQSGLLYMIGRAYHILGELREAEKMLRESTRVREKHFGKTHPIVFLSMSRLADVLDSQGKQEDAEQMHQQTLKMREKEFGKEHLHTLHSRDCLGNVLMKRGKFHEAKLLTQETVELRKENQGPEHPDTLNSMCILGTVLMRQGDPEAERILYETLKLREKVLYRGREHVDTLLSMFQVGRLLYAQGKYDEAIQIQRETLQTSEEIRGKEDPGTLCSMADLAFTLLQHGKHEEAIQMAQKTWELRKKVLGGKHQVTMESMCNLAFILGSCGRHDEAEPLQRETLALREEVLGMEHPDTQRSRAFVAWHDSPAGKEATNLKDSGQKKCHIVL